LGDLGTGVPERRGAIELGHGFEKGGLLIGAHYRDTENYDSPDGEVLNSGFRDYGFRARGDRYGGKSLLTVAWPPVSAAGAGWAPTRSSAATPS
jgi:hypothetical protein